MYSKFQSIYSFFVPPIPTLKDKLDSIVLKSTNVSVIRSIRTYNLEITGCYHSLSYIWCSYEKSNISRLSLLNISHSSAIKTITHLKNANDLLTSSLENYDISQEEITINTTRHIATITLMMVKIIELISALNQDTIPSTNYRYVHEEIQALTEKHVDDYLTPLHEATNFLTTLTPYAMLVSQDMIITWQQQVKSIIETILSFREKEINHVIASTEPIIASDLN